jgi:hypothetical protein
VETVSADIFVVSDVPNEYLIMMTANNAESIKRSLAMTDSTLTILNIRYSFFSAVT